MVTVMTRRDLLEQTPDSRERNIREEVCRQIEMQLPYNDGFTAGTQVFPQDRLADLGLAGTTAERFAATLRKIFPFLTEDGARAAVVNALLVSDLIRIINSHVGAA